MPFFKSSPNVSAEEKPRIEFHLQQLVECLGADRFTMPVLSKQELLGSSNSINSAEEILNIAGKHLAHDVSGITIQSVPLAPEKCGGGG